jgi:prepilin-type N-terminal cleavage/methylation domain-containing protein
MPRSSKFARRGLTLIELIVVVAILAVLAMIVIPKLDGIQGNANHAVGGNSAADTARYIQTYRTMKQRMPDGWDSLMNGSTLWAPANPSTTPVTKGLHTQLSGASSPKLSATVLTTTEAGSLQAAGIYTLNNLNAASTARPGDMFTVPTAVADGSPVAQVINTNMINHIYRDNLKSTGTSGFVPAGKRLIAFGFGPHNKLVGTLMMEAPSYPNVDATLVYNRNLVVFEVSSTSATSRAVFKGVFGADGDLLDDLITNMNKDPQ